MSIPSEASIFSYCSIFTLTNTKCRLKKVVDKVCHLLQNQIWYLWSLHEILVVYLMARIKRDFHVIFFVIIFFTTLYFFYFFFNSIPNICIFFSNSLFSLTESSKIKYLFPFFFFNISACIINKQIQRFYTVNIFIIINYFNCDVSNVININPFVMIFVKF